MHDHVFLNNHHKQQEIIKLINYLSSYPVVLPHNLHLFWISISWGTTIPSCFRDLLFSFHITLLRTQECYLHPHYRESKVNMKHSPQPTWSLSQSQDLSPHMLFPSLILPHLSAFKEPVCHLFSHTQPCWEVTLIILCCSSVLVWQRPSQHRLLACIVWHRIFSRGGILLWFGRFCLVGFFALFWGGFVCSLKKSGFGLKNFRNISNFNSYGGKSTIWKHN